MARKVFFSFHYERDAWRAGQIRNCNVIPKEDQVGVIDGVDWESIKKEGNAAIEKWINEQLVGTSVTAVLVGAETADREWVLYEIIESWNRGNGVVVIRIHNVKDSDGKTDMEGANPLDKFKLSDGTLLSSVCRTYDWVNDNGRDNVATWVDEAAEIRAEFDDEAEITQVVTAKKAMAVSAAAVGAIALGALAARAFASGSQATPASAPHSSSFSPRVPWGCTYDHDRR
jgi:hypothetical protein